MSLLLLHPKLVHLPIALAVVVPLVALAVIVAWRRNLLPRRAWLLVVGLQALLVGGGLLAMQTGELDEEPVERVVAERHIETHEEAAERFVWGGTALLGLMGLAGLLRGENAARRTATAATAGSLLVLLLGYQAGAAGGRLVYEHGAASSYASPIPHAPPAAGDDD
jgi:uncharacterized membrane protein